MNNYMKFVVSEVVGDLVSTLLNRPQAYYYVRSDHVSSIEFLLYLGVLEHLDKPVHNDYPVVVGITPFGQMCWTFEGGGEAHVWVPIDE